MQPRMHRKQYENAAKIVQAIETPGGGYTANMMRHMLVNAFSVFFADDNPAFSEERFAAACQPGANVKARVRE